MFQITTMDDFLNRQQMQYYFSFIKLISTILHYSSLKSFFTVLNYQIVFLILVMECSHIHGVKNKLQVDLQVMVKCKYEICKCEVESFEACSEIFTLIYTQNSVVSLLKVHHFYVYT